MARPLLRSNRILVVAIVFTSAGLLGQGCGSDVEQVAGKDPLAPAADVFGLDEVDESLSAVDCVAQIDPGRFGGPGRLQMAVKGGSGHQGLACGAALTESLVKLGFTSQQLADLPVTATDLELDLSTYGNNSEVTLMTRGERWQITRSVGTFGDQGIVFFDLRDLENAVLN